MRDIGCITAFGSGWVPNTQCSFRIETFHVGAIGWGSEVRADLYFTLWIGRWPYAVMSCSAVTFESVGIWASSGGAASIIFPNASTIATCLCGLACTSRCDIISAFSGVSCGNLACLASDRLARATCRSIVSTSGEGGAGSSIPSTFECAIGVFCTSVLGCHVAAGSDCLASCVPLASCRPIVFAIGLGREIGAGLGPASVVIPLASIPIATVSWRFVVCASAGFVEIYGYIG